jgi:hypothetical protein
LEIIMRHIEHYDLPMPYSSRTYTAKGACVRFASHGWLEYDDAGYCIDRPSMHPEGADITRITLALNA